MGLFGKAQDSERRTVGGWIRYLEDPDAQLTLWEFAVLCILHIRENGRLAKESGEHLEGMLSRFDTFMAADAAAGRYPTDERERLSLTERAPHG